MANKSFVLAFVCWAKQQSKSIPKSLSFLFSPAYFQGHSISFWSKQQEKKAENFTDSYWLERGLLVVLSGKCKTLVIVVWTNTLQSSFIHIPAQWEIFYYLICLCDKELSLWPCSPELLPACPLRDFIMFFPYKNQGDLGFSCTFSVGALSAVYFGGH